MARAAKTINPHPTSFPDLAKPLLGHAAQQAEIIDALASGRMHHGWLLHGPKGVGKARFAAQTSAFLVAEKARQNDGTLAIDTAHPDARLMAQGAHPDAHWIDKHTGSDGKKTPKVIPVASVRGTLQKLQSTAAYGGWRTLVVDSVDELNVEGANALLKPLEEPSQQTVLFLVAHALSAVLPTIRSRCRALSFSALPDDVLQALVPDGEATALAIALAQGRAGLAMELAADPAILDAFAQFCAVIAQPSHTEQRLAVAGSIQAQTPEKRTLLLGLIEDWLSRRVRGLAEPNPLPTPPQSLSVQQQSVLAALWSEHTSAIALRQAINLDLTERMMALFASLDAVYSQG